MKTLLALGAGALAMYFMDREHGPRRRAQLRDQLDRAKRVISERVRRGAADAEADPGHVSRTSPRAEHLER